MNEFAQSYAAIVKQEKLEDGTLKVYGKATDDSIDIDQQICDNEWLKSAMPDWFTAGGNIREQHSSIAAGVATDYEAKSDGHYITARIVDPVSVKKVETGVLKGFSIGIRNPRVIRDAKAVGGRIVGGTIVEISVVDRPANSNAKLMLAKAAENGELMAVEQLDIPTPGDLFKNTEAEIVEPTTEPEPEAVETVEAEVPAEETVTEEVSVDAAPEEELAEAAKSLIATLDKFDQATFDKARTALSELIVVEANEMSNLGYNEKESIEHLLDAIKHLFRWYEGEVAEGEVPGAIPEVETEDIYLSADAEDATADEAKCDKCDMMSKDCKCADKSVALDPTQVESIVEKAIASAKEAVTSEIELLKSALEAAEAKSMVAEAERDEALNKAINGGPKRTATDKEIKQTSELLQKAAELRLKAANSSDRTLIEGYKELAADLEAKAKKVG